MKYSCSPTTYYLSSIYFLQVSSFKFVVPSFFVIPGATVVSISNPRTKSSSGQNNGRGYIYFPPKYQNRNPLYQSISFPTLADSTSISSAVYKFTYRSAENKDLKTVSNLVCENLYRNSRTGWFIDKFIRIYRELDTQQALSHRMMSYMSSSDRKVTGESYRQHNMFVAVGVNSPENDQEDEQLINAPENDDMEKLIGFIEIGQVKMQSLIPDRCYIHCASVLYIMSYKIISYNFNVYFSGKTILFPILEIWWLPMASEDKV